MPVIKKTSYPGPPWYQWNGHLQTVVPTTFRRLKPVVYERERLELPDGDFLDLDWLDAHSRDLVILSHGLEGNSDRTYIKGMARFFYEQHWDVLAWNCRSCSGEMNRNFRLYYHGDIEDIGQVIRHVLAQKSYKRIVLIGFSMGGNITLKYLGVHGKEVPDAITHGIAFSTPCDLQGSIQVLQQPRNRFYEKMFYRRLEAKIRAKAEQFPGRLDLGQFDNIRSWRDFDTHFSAPLTGLSGPDEFYYEASSINFMAGTSIPTLVVNAQNDPLLDERSAPAHLADKHPQLFLETPRQGGHVGFDLPRKPYVWSELRAWEFCHS